MVCLLRDTPAISVVDDDESMRNGTLRLVRAIGYVAYGFSSAHAFLQSAQLAETACVISDIQMPEMNGLQLQDALRALGREIPIIFITAFPDERIRAEASARDAVCFLSKPFDGEALARCLTSALKRSTSRTE